MSTGDLLGAIASVFGLLTCKESLPALIWLALVIIFGIRFEKELKRMESNKENYDYLEDKEWEGQEQQSRQESRRSY